MNVWLYILAVVIGLSMVALSIYQRHLRHRKPPRQIVHALTIESHAEASVRVMLRKFVNNGAGGEWVERCVASLYVRPGMTSLVLDEPFEVQPGEEMRLVTTNKEEAEVNIRLDYKDVRE